jgi:hypothetical protein
MSEETDERNSQASTARARAGYWGAEAMRERLVQIERLLREAPSDPRAGEWLGKAEDLRRRLA